MSSGSEQFQIIPQGPPIRPFNAPHTDTPPARLTHTTSAATNPFVPNARWTLAFCF